MQVVPLKQNTGQTILSIFGFIRLILMFTCCIWKWRKQAKIPKTTVFEQQYFHLPLDFAPRPMVLKLISSAIFPYYVFGNIFNPAARIWRKTTAYSTTRSVTKIWARHASMSNIKSAVNIITKRHGYKTHRMRCPDFLAMRPEHTPFPCTGRVN